MKIEVGESRRERKGREKGEGRGKEKRRRDKRKLEKEEREEIKQGIEDLKRSRRIKKGKGRMVLG